MIEGFVFLDEVLDDVRWDAKYATWDNFTGKPVTGYEINRVVGTKELAAALLQAKKIAARLGYGLLLWDGYRPQCAVDSFLVWAKQPEDGYTKKKHYPKKGMLPLIQVIVAGVQLILLCLNCIRENSCQWEVILIIWIRVLIGILMILPRKKWKIVRLYVPLWNPADLSVTNTNGGTTY